MSGFEKVTQLLEELTPGEKNRLLQLLSMDLADVIAGIEATAGICGGEARIVRRRIPV